MQAIGNFDKRDVSLYFHIPFCAHKCPYCHFFVLPDKADLKKIFIDAILLEWEQQLGLLGNKKVVSIYFGGGTPSLLGPHLLGILLQKVFDSSLEIAPNCEITLEANPEDVTQEKIQAFASLGINRLSIGVQSLDDSSLNTLDRRHSAKKALSAIEATFNAGIHNLSIDLMYDLPNQTLSSWEKTLSCLEHLPLTHLSLYNLTIEPETLFYKNKKSLTPLLPTPEVSLNMLQMAIQHLKNKGFERYEISAFCKNDLYSRHNTGYWIGRPFLGFGPSAFSYWDQKRFRNIAHLSRYAGFLNQGKSPVDFEEKLPFSSSQNELLAVQLRLLEGVDLVLFQERHEKLSVETTQALWDLEQKGWLLKEDQTLKLSAEGLLFYDSVATAII